MSTGMPDDLRLELSRAFDVPSLVTVPSPIAVVAHDGTLLWANRAWYAFGRTNGAYPAAIGLGTNYFDAAKGDVRTWLDRAARTVLELGTVFEADYERLSPTRSRTFRMRIFPVPTVGLLFEHALRIELPRRLDPRPRDESAYRAESGIILTCSNCPKFRRNRGMVWDWVPAWLEAPPDSLSHGICPLCAVFYYR